MNTRLHPSPHSWSSIPIYNTFVLLGVCLHGIYVCVPALACTFLWLWSHYKGLQASLSVKDCPDLDSASKFTCMLVHALTAIGNDEGNVSTTKRRQSTMYVRWRLTPYATKCSLRCLLLTQLVTPHCTWMVMVVTLVPHQWMQQI